MSLGVIVRCDSGGLGNQTWEIWRHLKPDSTLVITAGDGARISDDIDRYRAGSDAHGLWHGTTRLQSNTLFSFAQSVDKVLTVECTYVHGGFDIIRDAGARGILLANPELYDPARDGFADVTLVPTAWGNAKYTFPILPQPVATDRFDITRRRSECKVFYHPTAPAMLDRNGTTSVLNALRFVTQPCKVYVRGKPQRIDTGKNVELVWLADTPRNYWDTYPDDADCLLLPRRYGGLCLPALETAALGMPALMTGLPPQHEWPHVYSVKAKGRRTARMKGGTFPVYDVDPTLLAAAMDEVITDDLFSSRSVDAASWAHEQSWDSLLTQWRRVLEAA